MAVAGQEIFTAAASERDILKIDEGGGKDRRYLKGNKERILDTQACRKLRTSVEVDICLLPASECTCTYQPVTDNDTETSKASKQQSSGPIQTI